MASVAPKVSTNAGSSTDSGCAATRHAAANASVLSGGLRWSISLAAKYRTAISVARSTDAPPPTSRAYATSTAMADSIAMRPSMPATRNADEHQARENRDVAAGDRDHVVGAGLLQPPLHLVVQAGAIADHDGGDDGRGTRTP